VRGPEQSRSPAAIHAEARQLAGEGCLEITLLGQTVNSYKYREGERTWRLSDLIAALHEIEGIARIKFVTNYPRDMSDDLLAAVRELPKCSKYLHVPVQSGSNAVLKRMRRGYTVEDYRETLARTYDSIPGVAVTSDFIVGFCGETDEDFEQTVDLVRESRFKNSFIFKYSERPGTKGADLYADDVPEDVKRRRNNLLLALQNQICEEDNEAFLGRAVLVLVEGPSKTAEKRGDGGDRLQLTGRTNCDRIVVFEGNRRQIGLFLPVVVYDANAHTLFGEVVTEHVGPEVFGLAPPLAAAGSQKE
jgi:tRNA-2-methylthio-N6-dimethylallyladenosine synthase